MATNSQYEESERRRKSVLKYTLRAALAYHIPLLAAYLACFLGLARFGYLDVAAIHIAILANSAFFVTWVKKKREIAKRDVGIQLLSQISVWLVIVSCWFLVMDDLRILVLFASVLALFFIFVQTEFAVSLAAITLVAADYIVISYIGINHLGQSGQFGRELLHALVFMPVSAFVAYLANSLRQQYREIRQSAHQRLEERRHGEKVQATLYQIANLAGESMAMEHFYQKLHEIISGLVYARNIYFAFVDEEQGLLCYPYKFDVAQPEWDDHPIPGRDAPGLSMTVIYSGEPFLYLESDGAMPPGTTGAQPVAWLGAPLKADNETVGVVAVQSYDPAHSYTEQDMELLSFVAGQVSTTIQRQKDKLALLEAHTRLEDRVLERTADLKRANAELRAATSNLVITQRQLAEAEKMASLGNLVAGIAHEINNPLGVAVTAASHAVNQLSKLSDQLQDDEDLQRVVANVRRATDMVLANLERSKKLVGSFKQVSADQCTGDRRLFNMAEYLEEIVQSLGPKIQRSGHQVTVECPDDVELDGYPSALYQIVSNLVMNSLVHAFADDEKGAILISVEPGEKDVLLSYEDSGRGLRAEEAQHIFEPFYTTRRGQGGTGLGMNIVFNTVTQMGGSIEICEPEKGARFEIRLPIVARDMPT